MKRSGESILFVEHKFKQTTAEAELNPDQEIFRGEAETSPLGVVGIWD